MSWLSSGMETVQSLWKRHEGILPERQQTRRIAVSLVLALAAALAVVAFMWGIGHVFGWVYGRASELGLARFAALSFLGITAAALAAGWLMHRFCPEAAGSGIPQLKVVFWKELGFVPWRAVWVKWLAGVISIGGGLSLGREGPCVYLGGGLASTLAGRLGVSKRGRRAATIGGAAAGLAAAFNTPLAAVAFALEEILSDFGSRLMGGVILAAVVGALVTHALLGPQPAFLLPSILEPRWQVYLALPLVAALGALVAVAFQAAVLHVRDRAARSRWPFWMRALAGAWITWALGLAVFVLTGRVGVFGLGYGDLSQAMTLGIGGGVAWLLLSTKWVATVCSYGFGGCGGIFSPTLFLGAMAGFGLASLLDPWIALTQQEHILMACVGMVACFGGTVRAPWTALLIVFEMTHDFALVPALLLATLVSQAVVRRFGPSNFYDAVLLQDGHRITAFAPPRRLDDWHETRLVDVATRDPVAVRDLSPAAVAALLRAHPYERFPVVEDGRLQGLVSRVELERAMREKTRPVLWPASAIGDTATIGQASEKLVEAEGGMVLILREGSPEPVGLITLHDLLRAQTAWRE